MQPHEPAVTRELAGEANLVRAGRRFGMDLNPASARRLDPAVQFLHQDCSQAWPLPDASLDLVFTSNFFEHLPDKQALAKTPDAQVDWATVFGE